MWDFIKDNSISFIASIISIIGFFKDNIRDIINAFKNKKINNSAVITVSYINEKLIISNKGKSNATDIEIYIDEEDKIVLKKYSNLKNIKDFSQKLVDSIYSITKDNIIITDNNNVIASAGSLKKEIINKELTEEYIIKQLESYQKLLESEVIEKATNKLIIRDASYLKEEAKVAEIKKSEDHDRLVDEANVRIEEGPVKKLVPNNKK